MSGASSLVDRVTVCRFLEIVHARAARAFEGADRPGVLQVTAIHPDNGAVVPTRFRIGDVDGMVQAACAYAESGHNVYVEPRTVTEDARGRGKANDTRGVFAFVVDSDADKNKAARLSGEPSLIVETSPGNHHLWLFLDRALPPDEASEIGAAIRESVAADHDTATPTQPYRVAGTPNFPGPKKRARGRVVTPTRILAAAEKLWTVDELRQTFPPKAKPERASEPEDGITGSGIVARLIIEPIIAEAVTPGMDRSGQFQKAVNAAVRFGLGRKALQDLMRRYPDGCCGKYLEPQDRLAEEIDRSWAKAERFEEERKNNDEEAASFSDGKDDFAEDFPGDFTSEPDPLEGLVERTAADQAAPFAPDVLKRLAELKKRNRAAFEVLREQLKKSGCRVAALDKAIAQQSGEHGKRDKPTHSDILIAIAESAELFHAPDTTGFADLEINGHRETWPIRSRGFRRWLARRFFEETGGAPSSEALQSALNVIEAKTHFDAPERSVHLRVAGLDGRLYLDLGDPDWRAVEINDAGWRAVSSPPVRFRRSPGMKALPMPVSGGSVASLRQFLNVRSDADFALVVGWMLACLRPRGPYPVLALAGEQGSAKSTFSALMRALLDPNTAALRALPREDRDLFITANNGHVLCFDNVSGLPTWISDTLCRLATGGGFAVRQLYSDADEMLFDATRPVILNGIEDIVTRPDLAERSIFLTLESIREERRRPEAELWAAFEAERPRILGALLDAVAHGLKHLPETHLSRLPRMADFCLWATACETAIWPEGTFWAAYVENREAAVEGVIESDPVAVAVRAFMAARTTWTGTASTLLGALAEEADDAAVKAKTWPGSPAALTGRLRRAATFLRKVGIEIVFRQEGKARTRTVHITRAMHDAAAEKEGKTSSASSASSATGENTNPFSDFAHWGRRTTNGQVNAPGGQADALDDGEADDVFDGAEPSVRQSVRRNPLKNNRENAADDADDDFHTQSGSEKTDAPRWSGRI